MGAPKPERDGHTFRLGLEGARTGELKRLQVLVGGTAVGHPVRHLGDGRGRAAPRSAARRPGGPGKPGRYRTTTGSYRLKSVGLPGFSVPVEMRAVVVAPTGVSGPRPLALFLCYAPHSVSRCRAVWC
ncbi:hypothetical protein ABZ357_34460 [Streptomyces sp. NPDC005917]|uniref:hypothetical protein n=1 Tax=unclassified Streptomyces TaxID=2593676 RepID=UPI00340C79B0